MSGRHMTQGTPSPGRRSRYEDPETSTDPAIRRIVSQLQALPSAPGPRAEFRAELRAQLVAVAPRLVAEGAPVDERDARMAGGAGSAVGRVWQAVRRGIRSRPVLILASAVAVFVLLLGGAVWISGSAVPGDSLYGLKRAGEEVKLKLSSGTDKGKQYLDLASKRIEEVARLVSRATSMPATTGPSAAPAGINPHIESLVRSTLNDADNDTRSAAQVLNGEAVAHSSADPLGILESWAGQQLDRIHQIVGRLDQRTPLGKRAHDSWNVVAAAQGRAKQLRTAILRSAPCQPPPPSDIDPFGPKHCYPSSTGAGALSPNSRTPSSVPNSSKTAAKSATSAGPTSSGAVVPSLTASAPLPGAAGTVIVVPSIPIVLPSVLSTMDPPQTSDPPPPPTSSTSVEAPPATTSAPPPTTDPESSSSPPSTACPTPTDTPAPPDSSCQPSPAAPATDSSSTS
jgi:Domain of unknown function (DUF5667)